MQLDSYIANQDYLSDTYVVCKTRTISGNSMIRVNFIWLNKIVQFISTH
jgi:hypothetical protein